MIEINLLIWLSVWYIYENEYTYRYIYDICSKCVMFWITLIINLFYPLTIYTIIYPLLNSWLYLMYSKFITNNGK
jgi:hypothetical protein